MINDINDDNNLIVNFNNRNNILYLHLHIGIKLILLMFNDFGLLTICMENFTPVWDSPACEAEKKSLEAFDIVTKTTNNTTRSKIKLRFATVGNKTSSPF